MYDLVATDKVATVDMGASADEGPTAGVNRACAADRRPSGEIGQRVGGGRALAQALTLF